MVDNIKQQLNVLSNALRVRNKKQEILASNIANAATPNYKARDVDFEVELARLLNEGPLKNFRLKTHGINIKKPSWKSSI